MSDSETPVVSFVNFKQPKGKGINIKGNISEDWKLFIVRWKYYATTINNLEIKDEMFKVAFFWTLLLLLPVWRRSNYNL